MSFGKRCWQLCCSSLLLAFELKSSWRGQSAWEFLCLKCARCNYQGFLFVLMLCLFSLGIFSLLKLIHLYFLCQVNEKVKHDIIHFFDMSYHVLLLCDTNNSYDQWNCSSRSANVHPRYSFICSGSFDYEPAAETSTDQGHQHNTQPAWFGYQSGPCSMGTAAQAFCSVIWIGVCYCCYFKRRCL